MSFFENIGLGYDRSDKSLPPADSRRIRSKPSVPPPLVPSFPRRAYPAPEQTEVPAASEFTRLRVNRAYVRAEERSARKYERFIRLAPDAVFIADADDSTIVEVNEKAVELTGYADAELRGMAVLDLHPPDTRNRYATLFDDGPWTTPRSTLDDGSQLFLRRSDGSDVPIELSVSPLAIDGQESVFGIVRNISSRRQQERDLRLKNKAIEELPVGITIGDATDPNVPIVYANEGFTTLTGYSNDHVLGRNCRFLQGEATDEATVAEIRAAIDSESPIRTELLNYRAGGAPFWNRVTIAPVTGDGTDAVTHFVGIQEDVTAQKRRERLIEVLNRVLRHNLSNEMNVVGGFADTIAERTTGKTAEMAERIQRASDRLVGLSDKARTFHTAVSETASPARRDVSDEVNAVVADLRTDFPDTEFRVEVDATGDVVATDALQLLLTELGENAAKHGGSSPVTYRVDAASDGDVTVRVTDRGPGLPETERRVLSAGQETPLRHSSGIGLWLANWIATDLGGRITTTVDGGTTVTVRLPPAAAGATTHRLSSALGTRDA